MKCGSILVYTAESKKPLSFRQDVEQKFIDDYLSGKTSINRKPRKAIRVDICQGKILAFVSAEDEPYFGGTSARLTVSYRCASCGQTSFPSLPNSYDISEWVTEQIWKM